MFEERIIGKISIEKIEQKCVCHNPAKIFKIREAQFY
jgi:hypothetical protein